MVDIKKAKTESRLLTKEQASLKTTVQGKEFYEQIRNALPQGGLTARRYISACLTALAVTPKLMQCKPSSVLKAFMESARYGLEPNSPLSEAALIPFGNTVQFLIEYRGMMKLAWNTGLVNSLDFDKVCENDHFVYNKGKGIQFEHTPNLKGDRGEAYAYYAIAELKNNGYALHVMSKDEILKHAKHFSRAFKQKNSPWQTDFDAMAYKTVIRQLCDKKLPKATTEQSLLLNEAAHIDDFVDNKVSIDEDYHVDIEPEVEVVKEEPQKEEPKIEEPKQEDFISPNDPGDEYQDVQAEIAEIEG